MISDCLSKATTTKANAIKQFRQISGIEEINMESDLTQQEETIIANLCSLYITQEEKISDWDEILNNNND